MGIDRFTKEQFEAALPVDKTTGAPLWESLGMFKSEECYTLAAGDHTRVIIRSSVDASGVAGDAGEDSIRLYLQVRKPHHYEGGPAEWCPLGKKLDAWTTRVPGWEGRMTEKLRSLYQRGLRVKRSPGKCPICAGNRYAGITSQGRNEGRPYASCKCSKANSQRRDIFIWLDQIEKGVGGENGSTGGQKRVSTETASQESTISPAPVSTEAQTRSLLDAVLSDAPPPPTIGQEPEAPTAPAIDLDEALDCLNDAQRQAVTAPVDAAVRVLAGPGSGKTRVIEHRYAWLIAQGVNPDNIVSVTLTKTMADEGLERIKRLSPQIEGTKAEERICTIHALCYRILKAEGDKRQVPKHWQIKKLLEEIGTDLWPSAEARPGWQELYSAIGAAKIAGLTSAEDLPFFSAAYNTVSKKPEGQNLHEARRLFDQRMTRSGWLTFGDMLFEVDIRLRHDAAFRAKWQAIIQYVVIDEGQDVTEQAMRVLTTLAKPQNRTFIVGDTDQLLFRFAGATPEANLFAGFESRYPDGLTVKLDINYRSAAAVINASGELIRYNYSDQDGPYDESYRKTLAPRPGASEGDPVTWAWFETQVEEASSVAQDISQVIESGQRQPGDFFIGARTRAQLAYLEGPLVSRKVPFINLAGGTFWDLKHVNDVVSYVKLALDESDGKSFQRVYNIGSNWSTHPWGESKGEYCPHRYLGRAFLDACKDGKTGEPSLKWAWAATRNKRSWAPGVEDLHSLLGEIAIAAEGGPGAAIQEVLDKCYTKFLRYSEGIIATDEAEDGKLSDLDTVIDLASEFATTAEFLAYVDEAVRAAEAAKDKEWGEYAVLATVHKLKGLERPVVYGIGWSEGLLPHRFSMEEPPQFGVLKFGSGLGRIEDERCCGFVLLSRAQEEAHLSGFAKFRKTELVPSRFVREIFGE